MSSSEKNSPPSPKRSKKEEIIWKSLGVFRRQGYHKTSIADLAQACGIHNAHFYYYFKDKENLLEECLRTVHGLFKEKVFALAYQADKSPLERMQAMHELTSQLFLKYEGGCIMANTILESAQYDASFLPVLKAFFDDWVAALSHLYGSFYQPEAARSKALQAVQDIEGGILLMRLYREEHYFLDALRRSMAVVQTI